MRLTDFEGYTELVTRHWERDQESRAGSADSSSEETIFEERVWLETDGYVYHPNLLDFTLGGLFGLIQQEFEQVTGAQARSSSDDGTLVEFDLQAQILKRKKYPATVFARRHRGLTPRPFLPSLETITTAYGFTWRYVSEKTPTSLQFNHSDVRLNPIFVTGETEEEGRQENTVLRFETGYNFSDHNTLSFVYERESVEERPFELDYDSDQATLSHRWEFGADHRHRLDSELYYFDQRGTFDLELARWRETLWLKHSDTLRSEYRFEAIDRTQGSRTRDLPPIQERSFYFSGALEHRLYESLTSHFLGFVQRQEFEPGLDIDRLGGQASFTYRKNNPWGALHVNYSLRAERNDHRGNVQLVEIVEEPHTFRDPEPVTLNNPNIDTGSMIIQGEDRVTFFQPGRDYTVRAIGDRVEIERVPTGQIVDGQLVLITYVFRLGGSFSLDTVGQTFGVRQQFDFGLAPYYRLEWQDQNVSPADATGAVPEDITAHIVGVEFRKSSLRLMAEYEDRDSTIDPLTAIRLSASYAHRFQFGATGSIGARWSNIQHEPPNEREVEWLTLDGRYRHPITSNLTVEGTVLYRLAEDSLSGDDEGVDLSFSLEWLVRKTEVRLTYEFAQFEEDFARNDSSTLYVQVRRNF